MPTTMTKPLGRKNYGSIGHLPGSRIGKGDHHVHTGQADICTKKLRDKWDHVVVQEKLDGSNVGVALVEGQILALGRAGYLAQSSPYEQHQLFAVWVRRNDHRFRQVLREGERLVGEWLAQAHGTRYELRHEPFVAFDLMEGDQRATYQALLDRLYRADEPFVVPYLVSAGPPMTAVHAMAILGERGYHGADRVEGAVWRVERGGKVDFLAKYVRPDKIDGQHLPECGGPPEPIWNWRPA